MRTLKLLAGLISIAALSGCVEDTGSSAPAQSAPTVGSATDVTAFQGARAGQAEGGLRNLGYAPIRSAGLTTYWFNRDTGACAEITTSDGRYSSVTMRPAEDC
ncbi:hypothetical protein ACQ5SP_02855 [Rhodovulum sp. YNF3179]|uniref:hypothetical protein n=1 Tax=Rhodovulum sp. YNF3179 TaxID=3425127 RepID=UPI003D3319F9